MRSVCAVCAVLALAGSARAFVVVFPDHDVDSGVRYQIGKPVGDITDTDLLPLTSLTVSCYSSLEGIQHCVNLAEIAITVQGGDPVDVIPVSLLANLRHINYTGRCGDFSSWADLGQLTKLEIYFNWEDKASLEWISSLPLLTSLWLSKNDIDDLSFLASMAGLETLVLECNRISDLSPISGLVNLGYLSLSHNFVQDLRPLRNLTNLRELHLEANFVEDLGPLLDNSGLGAGDRIYATGCPLSSYSACDVFHALQDRGALTAGPSYCAAHSCAIDVQPVGGWFEEGASLTLTTHLLPETPANTCYFWYKNGKPFFFSDAVWPFIPGWTSNLTLSALGVGDSGIYTCTMVRQGGDGQYISYSNSAQVHVFPKGSLPASTAVGLAFLFLIVLLAGCRNLFALKRSGGHVVCNGEICAATLLSNTNACDSD